MKNIKKARKSQRVLYYRHSVGIINKRRSGLRIVKSMVPVFAFVSIGVVGFIIINQNKSFQKQDTVQAASIAPIEPATPTLEQEPTQAVEDVSLSMPIRKQLESMPKGQDWAVFVRDLNSNRMVSVNADKTFDSASLYKLFMLAPLENKLPVKNWSSKLSNQSINSCVTAMIQYSDNACGEAVGNYVGWQYIDKFNQPLGFTKTKIGNKKQVVTARETGDLMYRLQNSQLLTDKARRLVFDALYNQKYTQGIKTGCGTDCLVANKTGESESVKHDTAVVTHGSSRYVVVILSKSASWNDVAKVEQSVDQAMLP